MVREYCKYSRCGNAVEMAWSTDNPFCSDKCEKLWKDRVPLTPEQVAARRKAKAAAEYERKKYEDFRW